jgi:hypothetical protein
VQTTGCLEEKTDESDIKQLQKEKTILKNLLSRETKCSYRYWVNENCVQHARRTLVYCFRPDLDCEKRMENAEIIEKYFYD